MANELKPCPFCGNEPSLNHMGSGTYTVPCSNGHHIYTEASKEKAVTAWNTRPAAPVEGLERYDLEDRSHFNEGSYMHPDETGEYVRFDQAEAIIAAERAEKEDLIHDLERLKDHETQMVADNAALTARCADWSKSYAEKCSEYEAQKRRTEALKTQLAAARKALEPFANVAEHDIGNDEDDGDIFWPMSNARYSMAGRLRVGDLRRARAALEDKP